MTILYKYLAGFAILFSVLFGAYAWHLAVVKVEVNKAVLAKVQEIDTQNLKDKQELLDKAKQSEQELKDNFTKCEKELQNEIKTTATRLGRTIAWLRSQSRSTEARGGVSDTPRAEQDQSRSIIGGLSLANGEHLAEYGAVTEELKLHLIACYKDYDTAVEVLEKFKKEHSK